MEGHARILAIVAFKDIETWSLGWEDVMTAGAPWVPNPKVRWKASGLLDEL